MGDVNQSLYLQQHIPSCDGPILEVGSKEYGNTATFRSFYRDAAYTGVDLSTGNGVDVVHDLSSGPGPFELGSFKLIICCSVMEHSPHPWRLADVMTSLLAPGGTIYVSVPWVWRYHPYPDDYFRFSHKGVMAMFPDLAFTELVYSTTVPGEFKPITDERSGNDDRMATFAYTLKGKRKSLPYLMVNMLGKKA
jgi:hypothetical protein